MQDVLAVTIPYFALVLLGYLAADRRAIPSAAIPGLDAFALRFALPCLLFRIASETTLAAILDPAVIAIYGIAALVLVLFTIAVTRSRRVRMADAALGALAAASPSTAMLGVPVILALVGPAAAGPMLCALLIDSLLSPLVGYALARRRRLRRPRSAAIRPPHRAATAFGVDALPWAILLGGAIGSAHLHLSGPVLTIVRTLAEAASAVALFSVGAILWRSGSSASELAATRRTDGRETDLQTAHDASRLPADDTRPGRPWTPVQRYLPLVAIKLALHPLLVLLLASSARSSGLPIGWESAVALTLTAALPSASGVASLASRFGADRRRIARAALASTMVALVSFALFAWALGVRHAA